jgi:mRNA-degrading endonuclease YafQ of YafQ-DinJ toxin-antitoxin module
MAKSPTLRQLFNQKQKINKLKDQLHTEEWKLHSLINNYTGTRKARVNYDNVVYDLSVSSRSCFSQELSITKVGTAEELAALVNK